MEYLFILGLQIFGILFHVGKKIYDLDKKYPEMTVWQILSQFFELEWSSLGISLIIIMADLFIHSIIDYYDMPIEKSNFVIPIVNWTVSYLAANFIIAFFLGLFGQSVAYRYFGKIEEYALSKADKIN